MSIQINTAVVAGNLTKDPELNYTKGNEPIVSFVIANNRKFKSQGEPHEEVSFVGIVTYGLQAKACQEFLKKGHGVIVEGRIKQERWKEGTTERSKTLIVAHKVHFISKKPTEPADQESVDP